MLQIFSLVLLLTYGSLTSAKAFFGKSKPPIAPPYIDSDLEEFHFKHKSYENKLDYKNDDYIFLYTNDNPALYEMDGTKLLSWNSSKKFDFKRVRLMDDCSIMFIDGHKARYLQSINTNGDTTWNYKAPGGIHHDFEVDNKSNITFLYGKAVPEGFTLKNNCENNEVSTDAVFQINKSKEKTFEWFFHENYTKLLNAKKCNLYQRKQMKMGGYSHRLDWAHPNAINVLPENKWFYKGYKEFKPGNILVTSHHLNRIFIIEKDTGKVVWVFKGGSKPLDGPHEAKMIAKNLPGGGNIMIFDNGKPKRKYSRLIEVNPISKKIIWEYSKPGEFYNLFAGSHQRLKNGDTFISDDTSARVFIVNKDKEIIWQYIHPSNKYSDGDEYVHKDKQVFKDVKPKKKWIKRASIYLKKDFAHCLPES